MEKSGTCTVGADVDVGGTVASTGQSRSALIRLRLCVAVCVCRCVAYQLFVIENTRRRCHGEWIRHENLIQFDLLPSAKHLK